MDLGVLWMFSGFHLFPLPMWACTCFCSAWEDYWDSPFLTSRTWGWWSGKVQIRVKKWVASNFNFKSRTIPFFSWLTRGKSPFNQIKDARYCTIRIDTNDHHHPRRNLEHLIQINGTNEAQKYFFLNTLPFLLHLGQRILIAQLDPEKNVRENVNERLLTSTNSYSYESCFFTTASFLFVCSPNIHCNGSVLKRPSSRPITIQIWYKFNGLGWLGPRCRGKFTIITNPNRAFERPLPNIMDRPENFYPNSTRLKWITINSSIAREWAKSLRSQRWPSSAFFWSGLIAGQNKTHSSSSRKRTLHGILINAFR